MDHHNQGIKRKLERRYSESTGIVASIFFIIGSSFFISLVFFWPQKYSSDVFNSRLSYHLTTDVDDYSTCNKDYRNFIVDEPTVDDAMMTFYVFNVTNPSNVLSRGFKPLLEEIGPYGYKKSTYKYNVTFNPNDDSDISFQEYIELQYQSDPLVCRKNYFRIGRAEGQVIDPCITGMYVYICMYTCICYRRVKRGSLCFLIIGLYVYICIYLYRCTCMYILIYIYMYVCVYVYIHRYL
jgi:hypothetical protein